MAINLNTLEKFKLMNIQYYNSCFIFKTILAGITVEKKDANRQPYIDNTVDLPLSLQ